MKLLIALLLCIHCTLAYAQVESEYMVRLKISATVGSPDYETTKAFLKKVYASSVYADYKEELDKYGYDRLALFECNVVLSDGSLENGTPVGSLHTVRFIDGKWFIDGFEGTVHNVGTGIVSVKINDQWTSWYMAGYGIICRPYADYETLSRNVTKGMFSDALGFYIADAAAGRLE